MLTLIMLISHTVSDFIIQTNDLVERKSKLKIEGFLYHGLSLLATSLPIMLLVDSKNYFEVLSTILIIIGIHLGCDAIKEKIQSYLTSKSAPKAWYTALFLCDQFIHIIFILLITKGTVIEFNSFNNWLQDAIFAGNGLTVVDLKQVFIILYISFSGAYFVPLVFDIVYEKVDNYTEVLNELLKNNENEKSNVYGFIDEVKTGKWIGILERLLILFFLYSNQLASIGLIIAVKSLARFKMMDNKIFSEYFLLGTLLSVVYTFIVYSIFQRVF